MADEMEALDTGAAGQEQAAPPGGNGDPVQSGGPEFSVPEAYREKGWASKVKSLDDVYRQIDNLDSLAGKKTIGALDYDKATPDEIEAYHAKLRPEGIDAYGLAMEGEGSDPAFARATGEAFLKAGLNAHQGKMVMDLVNDYAKASFDAAHDATGYLTLAKESFGDDHEKTLGVIANAIKANASPDDLKVFDEADNTTRIALDRLVHKISTGYEAKIAQLRTEYGVEEKGTPGAGAGSPGRDKAAQRSEIRSKLWALDQRSHSQAEKDALLRDLSALS